MDQGNAGDCTDSAINRRARTAAEIGDQLLRDATSLTLTGESFAKDKHFYDNVAANLREAAAKLQQWGPTIEEMRKQYDQRERQARVDAYCKSQEIAVTVANLAHRHLDGPATTWRICGLAINEAIQVVRDSFPRQLMPAPVTDERR